MKKALNLFTILLSITLCLFMVIAPLSGAIAEATGLSAEVSFGVAVGGLSLLSYISTPVLSGIVTLDIRPTIWARDIAENIYPDNSFYQQSRDDSEFLEGKTVRLPQAGAKPNVEVNRASLPASAIKRADTTADYDIDEFTTDPVLVQDTEAIEASYDKRQSVLFDHQETLKAKIADRFGFIWSPTLAANIIRTTGDVRLTYREAFGATGNRKAVKFSDIQNADRIMTRMDIPREGRFMLVDADLLLDIQLMPEFKAVETLASGILVSGALGKIASFDVYVRSRGVLYNNAATPAPKDPNAVGAATDNSGILFWHKMFVRRALGNGENGGIKIFSNENDPQFFGSIFSALVRAGGRIARADQKGVVALVEAASV